MLGVERETGVCRVGAAGAAWSVEGEVAAEGRSGEGADGGRRCEGDECASSGSVRVFRAAHGGCVGDGRWMVV